MATSLDEQGDSYTMASTLDLIASKRLGFVVRVCMRLSLEDVSARTGINKVRYGEIERRMRPPNEEEAEAIRDMLMGRDRLAKKTTRSFRLTLRAMTVHGEEVVLIEKTVQLAGDCTEAMVERRLSDMCDAELGRIVSVSWVEID